MERCDLVYVSKKSSVSFIYSMVSKKGFRDTLTILAIAQGWALELQREECGLQDAGIS